MYQYRIEKKSDSQREIIVEIPKSTLNQYYEKAFEELRKNLTLEGFRKGTVPKKIAEQKIKKEKIYQKLIELLLPEIYIEIVKKENLQPITNPKIELVKAKEGEDWQIKITIALKPKVKLGDYKKKISELNKKYKKVDIWVPGKSEKKETEKEEETQRLEQLNQIFQLLLQQAECEIPDLLIEEELNRKLSNLIDELQKVGLTLETYLNTKNLTLDQLKENYKKEINDTYKLEFILNEISDQEKIVVENKEIEEIIAKIDNEKDKELARQNSYYYAAILRKQKTLDFLLNL